MIKRRLKRSWRRLQRALRIQLRARELYIEPGHFYSPIPGRSERDAALRARPPLAVGADAIAGVPLDADAMFTWLQELEPLHAEFAFATDAAASTRYRPDNPFFSLPDAFIYYGFLRTLRPRRVVEVGSGYSSALALDVNDRFLGGSTHFTFIEPYPRRLLNLVGGTNIELHDERVQDVKTSVFEELEAGDVLFVDSSHVCKLGSDVHWLFLEILPRLRPGVWVHVHDIFFPFEYPEAWVREGRAWNEAYLLRAFLCGNGDFQVRMWMNYLRAVDPQRLTASLPSALHGHPEEGSLWMQRAI